VEVVYANTITQSRIVSAIDPLALPVVTHVHELERELRARAGLAGIERVINQSDMLISVSGAVRKMLIAHGADAARIVDIPEPIGDYKSAPADMSNIRAVLDVEGDTVVVIGCGFPSWRKGTDVFLRVAQHVIADAPAGMKIAFRWIGGTPPNEALATLVDDIACLGLESQVVAIPHRPDAAQLLAAADVFICTSREDPNPLVVLEAAAVGCPVVCFQDTGGAEELADAGGGRAVPFLDTKAMADAVLALIKSPEERRRLGDNARRLVTRSNMPNLIAQDVGAVLRQCARHAKPKPRQAEAMLRRASQVEPPHDRTLSYGLDPRISE
jgi:glycosyltransferase involved in cell wall biosynthesis